MAAEAQTEAPKVVAEAEELPKAIVRRVVKDKLSECSDSDSDIALHKDALLAFSESARIFIHYLSATANDICKESKRQTISADDVLNALDEMEFPEFIEPLKASLDDFRRKNAEKKAASPNAKENNKRKKEGTSQAKDKGKKKKEEETPQEKDGGKGKKEEETPQTKDGDDSKEEETSQAKGTGDKKNDESNDNPQEDCTEGGE